MKIRTMDELFVETLKDIYYAEKHILKAMLKMAKKAHGAELKKAIDTHREETEGQVERLEKAFEMMEVAPRGKKCEAIEGILRESQQQMALIEDDEVRDAEIIGSAQAIEHYEISRYGTLIEWAKELGLDKVVGLLEQNLEQEKNADNLLMRLPKSTMTRKTAAE